MSIALMICYSRSGGTLLNKCLGSLPDTVVMSEVNPLGGGDGKAGPNSYKTVWEQALHWYGIELKSRDFRESITELGEYCEKHNKKLVIRDWSHANFAKIKLNNFNPPNQFLTLKALKDLNPTIFIFVRDAIDIWISSWGPDMNTFFEEYITYVKAVKLLNAPIYKYENFVKNPEKTLKEICETTSLEYRDVTRSYYKFEKANGDTQIKGSSRGALKRKIIPLKRIELPKEKILELNRNRKMIECNQFLGYSTDYYSSISMTNRIKFFCKRCLTNRKY
ncbi:MAG: hypothetical protein GY749_26755 [Desulfobacteraceae bacterium]|nr:hypothetical protein [Desulfobacteraceae bacterium]